MVTKTGLEVLELFVEAASLGTERVKAVAGFCFKKLSTNRPQVHDAEHRRQWKAEWNRRPEVMARSKARAAIQRAKKAAMQVEIFWDGDGFYYANLNSSERLGGPFEKIHSAWKHADSRGLEVVGVATTRKNRTYRKVT